MKEHCCLCDTETGRAGKLDDSIYIETSNGEVGPLCETCHSSIQQAIETRCKELAEVQKPTANTTQAAIARALVRVMQELDDYLGVDFSHEIDEVQRAAVR